MGKLDVRKTAYWVSIIFTLIAPIENIYRIEQYLYIIGVLILAVCFFRRRYAFLNETKYIVAFMLYMFIASIWSINENAFSIETYAQFIFLFLQLQFEYTREEIEKFKTAFLLQNWILLIICFTNGYYMDNRFWIRSVSSGADPNYLSGWFVIPLCFAVEYIMSGQKKMVVKIAAAVQIILSMYFVMQTASRGGFLSCSLAVIICVLYALRKSIRKNPMKSLLICGVLVTAVILIFNNVPDYLQQRLSRTDYKDNDRTKMWSTLIKRMLDNPAGLIFGFGTNSVIYYTGNGMISHNTYLDLLFNYGMFGGSLFYTYVIKGLRSKLHESSIVIAFITMSVSLSTVSALNTRYFMFILFLLGMKHHRE